MINSRQVLLIVCLALTGTAQVREALAEQPHTVDVVHFWISKSETQALDVFRQAWAENGNRWIDLPAKNKVEVQRAVSERVANGYAPAVMQWNANEGSRELPEMGIVRDIDSVAREDNWRDILPAAVLDRITYHDKVYFAPTNIHAENWLWTSQTVFDELGLKLPETWQDIFDAAEKLQAAGTLPIALGGGPWEVSLIFNGIVYERLGAEGYARAISGNAEAVNDPRFLEALQTLRRLSLYAEPFDARREKSWADATATVGRGAAGMQFMGDWAKGELIARGYEIGKDFECSFVPGTEIAYFMVIDAFAFPVIPREGSDEAQLAFARMVLDRDNQVKFSRIKGSLPVRLDVDMDKLDRCGKLGVQMLQEENREISAQSMAMPSQMSEGWIGVLSDFFNNREITPEEAQRRLYDVIAQG
ncbi:ABC transporter substrate-binding protein [Roseibium salinum]|uniref:Probable sugar-binding periplasmic protein n=1 Tax=Roseibium salinum TaxID=1604349 RepID=A0ABT3QX05_9HYPH|nr:ABC transporter substrate-binding protein [Roseibium sp. DSM 29163]MCX2721467.1 ABC transporter substrate-binding protein [Roseibium sp. DSM 29163]